jgi:hypothetical protein
MHDRIDGSAKRSLLHAAVHGPQGRYRHAP